MAPKEKFSIGDYWLDREPKSPNWLRCWYDPGARKVRRRTLETADFEEAKIRLAAFVLDDPASPPDGPESVPLIVVFKHYWETYSDHRPDPGNARRAGDLVLDYLGDDATVGQFMKSRQEAFMRWLVEEFDHSVATISRNLSIVNAAFRRATEPHIVKGTDGNEVVRQILQ